MATLVLNNISKAFTKGTPVVREMNLRVADGEFIVIVGPSGCGKSTTLRLIAGLEAPDTGQVLLDGEDIAAISPGGRNIALVFQDYALYAGMSVFENIAFPLRMRKGCGNGRTAQSDRAPPAERPETFRRRETACCHGTGDRASAPAFSDGRTAVESGRQAERTDPQGNTTAAPAAGNHNGVCHP